MTARLNDVQLLCSYLLQSFACDSEYEQAWHRTLQSWSSFAGQQVLDNRRQNSEKKMMHDPESEYTWNLLKQIFLLKKGRLPGCSPLIYVQSPGAMSRHKSPMVCIQRLRLLCSQVLGVQKLFGDAVLFLFGVSFVAYNAIGQHQVSTNVRTTPRYCKERNLVNIVGYVYIYPTTSISPLNNLEYTF